MVVLGLCKGCIDQLLDSDLRAEVCISRDRTLVSDSKWNKSLMKPYQQTCITKEGIEKLESNGW
jgi:hypothetical protein